MYRIRQSFDTPRLGDVANAVREQMASLNLGQRVQPGQSVEIGRAHV